MATESGNEQSELTAAYQLTEATLRDIDASTAFHDQAVARIRDTLGAAEYLVRLHADGLTVKLPEPPVGRGDEHVEFAVAALIAFQSYSMRARPVVERVCFRHEPRASAAQYERVFGVMPRFNQPECSFVLRYFLAEHEAEHAEQIPSTVVRRLETLLMETLGHAPPSLAQAARHLGVTTRTLQRRLRAEGTTYREVWDRVLASRALRLLKEPVSIGDVAAMLGFSEASAFHRAFRRWTGKSPSEYLRPDR